ncbi:hypothetical protein Bca4012_062504 [Brassica carinata]
MKELLPHDVIEYILERLDVKTLLKFTTVSKQWKPTIIQCRSFQTRQMLRRKQSGKTDVVLVSLILYDGSGSNPNIEALRTFSCDGLICLYDLYDPSIVVNPTTRWHRTIPPCNYQLETFDRRIRQTPSPSPGFGKDKINGTYKVVWLYKSAELVLWSIPPPLGIELSPPCNYQLVVPFDRRIRQPSPGFGKDKINGTYKVVWLYNSAELGLKNKSITTCEVFDFTANALRYVVSASPYGIHDSQDPVYCDGSLHWLTNGDETNVLSLDLHTETFQVIPKLPFLPGLLLIGFVMCSLDDRLCVSQRIWPGQGIWSFDSEDKTWKKIYSINLKITSFWLMLLTPLSVQEKDKLLFYDRESSDGPLVTCELKTKSFGIAYECKVKAYALSYVPSLISIL